MSFTLSLSHTHTHTLLFKNIRRNIFMTLSWETISLFFFLGNNFLSKTEKAQLIREKFNKPNYIKIQNQFYRTFLAVQWLRLCASNAGGSPLFINHVQKLVSDIMINQKASGRIWQNSRMTLGLQGDPTHPF